MDDAMECMCLQCGISMLLSVNEISFEDVAGAQFKLVKRPFCTECGGQLALIAKAGEEPHYKVG